MSSNVTERPSSPFTQSQIAGWTVLREPRASPSSMDDSGDSSAAEGGVSIPKKRKSKNDLSSRPAKSLRISGNIVSTGASRPSTQARHTLGSVTESQAPSHADVLGTSFLVHRAAKTSTTVQPIATGSRPLADKSLTGTRPLSNSKSVPSLRRRLSWSPPVLKPKYVDGAGSSSSDSLPDPTTLLSQHVSRPKKSKLNETGEKEKASKDIVSARNGFNGVSSVPNDKNPSTSRKRSLPKPRAPVRDDIEVIIISSDSGDDLPTTRKNLSSRRRSRQRSNKEQSSGTVGKKRARVLTDVDIIDLCSDSDEAMEVDGLLAGLVSQDARSSSAAALPSPRDSQPDGNPPPVTPLYALPLSEPPSRASFSSPHSFPLPSSSPFSKQSQPTNESLTKSASGSVEREVEDLTSSSKWRNVAEAESLLDIKYDTNIEGVPGRNLPVGLSTSSATSIESPLLNSRTCRTNTPNTITKEVSSSSNTRVDLAQDPTETLVAPVSGMHLQMHSDVIREESPDPIDVFETTYTDADVTGSISQNSNREHTSPVSSSPLGSSKSERSKPSGRPIQLARKRVRKPLRTDDSDGNVRSDRSERDGSETQEERQPDATPSRQVISVKEPDFSKLRADDPSALDDSLSLSDAIQWPAERIPTELHDMLNNLPAHYHRNPHMKYIFESMMEENTADDEPTSPRIEVRSGQNGPVCPPWEFYYTNRIFYGKGVPRSDKRQLRGCDCDGPCDPDSKTCACVQRQKAWTGDDKSIKGFLYNKKGKVYNPGYPIFECNDACECSEGCMNRVIQNGRQHQISICLTDGKGWGVYADEKIPRGTYLGIYAGEMLLESEAAERGNLYDKYGRTYLFDLDFYYLHSLEADKQKTSPSKRETPFLAQGSTLDKDEEKTNLYTIDAFHVGNFTRFMNHSCDPNCAITPSYVNEPDLQKPTLTIFTTRDVKRGEELCFSYFGNDDDDDEEEEKVDEHGQKRIVVVGPGTHTATAIHRPCLCGAPNCRGKMF